MMMFSAEAWFQKLPRGKLLRWLGWFSLANVLLLAMVSVRYFAIADVAHSPRAVAFAVAASLGHFASLAAIGLLLTIPIVLLVPRKGFVFLFTQIVMSIVLILLIVDTFVFAQYRYHINGMVLGLIFGGAASEIFSFSAGMWLLFALLAAACVAFQWWLGRMAWRWVERIQARRYGYYVAAILASVFLVENIAYAWADASAFTPITKQIRILPGYAPLTAKKFFDRHGLSSSPELAAGEDFIGASAMAYPAHPMECDAPAKPLNILFIVIDSWRFDTLTPEITPNIAALRESSWRFENHYSGANSTRTGIFTLMYGIPGTYWHAALSERRGSVLIGELLRQKYQFAIFGSAKLTSPEFDRTVFAQLHDLRTQSQGSSPSERDQNITDEFVKFVDGIAPGKPPFFGFLFYDSPHGYDIPPNYPSPFQPSWDQVNYLLLNNDSDPVPFFNRYKNSVHYVDSLAGRVLDRLSKQGLLDNTLIIITGDHGQEFNDNKLNYWGHNGNFSRFQLQVPLLIRWPGKAPQSFTHRTTHFDVVPTLMHDVLGCKNEYRDYSSGTHLTDASTNRLLVVSSYNKFGIVDKDRTIVADEFNDVEVMGSDYRPTGESFPPAKMAQALDEMRQFYKR